MTRKVGLLFEEDKDVIVEVYNSWYSLFGIIRDLLKEIEPRKKDKDLEKLENILVKTLNYGLKPTEFKRETLSAIARKQHCTPNAVRSSVVSIRIAMFRIADEDFSILETVYKKYHE